MYVSGIWGAVGYLEIIDSKSEKIIFSKLKNLKDILFSLDKENLWLRLWAIYFSMLM